MEGFDRPLFPELLPTGMVISGKLLPTALKPFPSPEEQEEEARSAEEALENPE